MEQVKKNIEVSRNYVNKSIKEVRGDMAMLEVLCN
jgi:hypothetical protein